MRAILFLLKITTEQLHIFYGKPFIDRQMTRVYRLIRNDRLDFKLQEEEIESVMWMDYEECLKVVEENTINHCIFLEELRRVRP